MAVNAATSSTGNVSDGASSSGTPPTGVERHGNPTDIASSSTRGMPSVRDGWITASRVSRKSKIAVGGS